MIVRVALPQADDQVKVRPALLLKPIRPHSDWLLCAISTQLHNEVAGLDVLIDVEYPDFGQARFLKPSIIRVVKLHTMPEARIEGSIGTVSDATYNTVMDNLIHFLKTG